MLTNTPLRQSVTLLMSPLHKLRVPVQISYFRFSTAMAIKFRFFGYIKNMDSNPDNKTGNPAARKATDLAAMARHFLRMEASGGIFLVIALDAMFSIFFSELGV